MGPSFWSIEEEDGGYECGGNVIGWGDGGLVVKADLERKGSLPPADIKHLFCLLILFGRPVTLQGTVSPQRVNSKAIAFLPSLGLVMQFLYIVVIRDNARLFKVADMSVGVRLLLYHKLL